MAVARIERNLVNAEWNARVLGTSRGRVDFWLGQPKNQSWNVKGNPEQLFGLALNPCASLKSGPREICAWLIRIDFSEHHSPISPILHKPIHFSLRNPSCTFLMGSNLCKYLNNSTHMANAIT